MHKNSLKNPRTWMLVLASALSAGVLVVVVATDRTDHIVVALILIGVFLLVMGLVYTEKAIDDHTSPEPEFFGDPSLESVSSHQLDRLVNRQGLGLLDNAHLFSFVDPILYPHAVFTRISELVESFHRSTVVHTTFAISLSENLKLSPVESPSSDSKGEPPTSESEMDFIVPLIVPLKGELLEGLKAFDAAGNRVTTLNSSSQLLISLGAIRGLVRLSGVRAFSKYVANLENDVINGLRGALPLAKDDRTALVARFASLPARKDSQHILTNAGELAEALLRLNPVCVTIPTDEVRKYSWPNTIRASIERRYVARIEDAPGLARPDRLSSWLDGVRLALGVRLHRTFFPLVNATRTNSYHATVAGPDGTYLAAQAIVPGGRSEGSTVKANARFQTRLGQRRAHLHARSIEAPDGAFFAVHFFERAPGSFLLSTLTSFATALVVTILGVRELNGIGAGAVNLNMLPILLAVPIGVAALSGFENSRPLRHPSLLSRLVTFFSIVLALWALLLMAISSGLGATDFKQWILLISLAWTGTVVSLLSWVIRLRVEHHFSNQKEEQ